MVSIRELQERWPKRAKRLNKKIHTKTKIAPIKPTILHIIPNFGRGGAETMLVSVLKELKEYNNIVLTLYPDNKFTDPIQYDQLYCLNLKSVWTLPFAKFKVRKFIKEHKVDLVHTHLYWPNFIGRLATPKHIPLLTTIHTSIAYAPDYKKKIIRLLDRFTYNLRPNIIIGVSKTVLDQYFSVLKIKPVKTAVLYTFVDTRVFKSRVNPDYTNEILNVVTVGNLRPPKNHKLMIEAFELLKGKEITLDIYGEGPLEKNLDAGITNTNVNVLLKGQVEGMENKLWEYDLFLMASAFEGFSLSVLEAMSMGLPLLLSDIPSFREQGEGAAEFFPLGDPKLLAEKIRELHNDREKLLSMGAAAKERVNANFTLEHHMAGLRKLYTESLAKN